MAVHAGGRGPGHTARGQQQVVLPPVVNAQLLLSPRTPTNIWHWTEEPAADPADVPAWAGENYWKIRDGVFADTIFVQHGGTRKTFRQSVTGLSSGTKTFSVVAVPGG